MTCTAEAALTADEVKRIEAMPDADFGADTEPRPCEFGEHGPEVRHTFHVQSQHTSPEDKGVIWWLQWTDDGQREMLTAPYCHKLDSSDDTCLLIAEHPGDCDTGIYDEADGTGWVLVHAEDQDGAYWELREDGALLYDNDLDRTRVNEAKAWGAEVLLDAEKITVTGWVADPEQPDRWTAQTKEI